MVLRLARSPAALVPEVAVAGDGIELPDMLPPAMLRVQPVVRTAATAVTPMTAATTRAA